MKMGMLLFWSSMQGALRSSGNGISGFSVLFWLLFLLAMPARSQDSANEWTWMGGSNTVACNADGCSQPGVYGTLGTPALGNVPSGREGAATWTDKSGDLWLFGGTGFDASSSVGSLNDLWEFNPSTNLWAWMGGSKTVGANGGKPGVYGTLGVPAAANIPGGRYSAVSWTDSNGNLWLFGGYGFDSGEGTNDAGRSVFLNDLWELNPSTLEWTWMGGSSSTVCPSSSADGCGQSGVYGTKGTSGSGNIPGGRLNATAATDSNGNFWLFGGYGYAAAGACCYLNDLWEFNPSTNQWTWVSGGSGGQQPGVYGTLGTHAGGNVPGSRYVATSWFDDSGHFWLYGGYGFDAGNVGGYLDDLWEFNPSTDDWVWLAGSDSATCWANEACPATAIYGTLGVPASANLPGDRAGASSWTDKSGNFWLFGSDVWHINGTVVSNNLNDLWELDPSSQDWAWMAGSSSPNQPGIFGTLGTPAPGNAPGGRDFASGWTDSSGNLWLFGGSGLDAAGNSGWLNDLWKFQPITATSSKPTPMVTVTPSPSSITTVQALTVTVCVSGNPTPTGTVALSGSYTSASTTLSSGCATIDIPAGSLSIGNDTLTATYTPDSSSSAIYNSATGSNSVNVAAVAPAAATPSILPGTGTSDWPEVVTVSDGTPGAAIYFTTDNTTPTANSTLYTGPIIVASNETLKAIAMASGYASSNVASATYTIETSLSGAGPQPVIQTVSAIQAEQTQTITITGSGFGTKAAYNGDSGYIRIIDGSGVTWGAGYVNSSLGLFDDVTLVVSSWTDSQIVLSGFGGSYGAGGWYLSQGDQLWGLVWNAQTGVGPFVCPNIVVGAGATNCSTTLKITPTIAWATPAPITYGTALSATQLDASSGGVAGTFAYTPVAGTVLGAGSQQICVNFTPTNMTAYNTPPKVCVTLQVNKAVPICTWSAPAAIPYGTPLNGTQLDVSCDWPIGDVNAETAGNFAYTPVAGTLLGVGSQTLSATFTPTDTADFNPPAPVTTSLTVMKDTPTVGLTPAPANPTTAQALAVTVSVSGLSGATPPSGQVTLSSGGYSSGSVSLANGDAIITIPANTLPMGTDTLAVSYSGDANYNPITGGAPVTVMGFAVAGGTAVSVAPGATTGNTSTITVTPGGGFTGNVTLAATSNYPSADPAAPTFSFGSTSPVSITGASAGTATLTITTTAQSSIGCTAANQVPSQFPWYSGGGAVLACVLLFGIPARQRRWLSMFGMLALLIALTSGLLACGGSSTQTCTPTINPGTATGTYTITVTGTSGAITETSTVTLTVQ